MLFRFTELHRFSVFFRLLKGFVLHGSWITMIALHGLLFHCTGAFFEKIIKTFVSPYSLNGDFLEKLPPLFFFSKIKCSHWVLISLKNRFLLGRLFEKTRIKMRYLHVKQRLEGAYFVLCSMGGKSQPAFTSGRNLQNLVKFIVICSGVFQISTWPHKRCVHAVEAAQPFA